MEQNVIKRSSDREKKAGRKRFPVSEKIKSREFLIYVIVAVLSAAAFCAIYGVRVLNPTYTDWMISGGSISQVHLDLNNDWRPYAGDLPQHYLGWKAYRASAWHFPIGMIDNLAGPELISVVFTDSIPALAVFFKILSPILPDSFQYFGLWGLLCFILQGVLAARIIRKYTDNPAAVIPASLLFVFAPAMLWRMFFHTSLAGQWILLLAIEPIFDYDKYAQNPRKPVILTAVLGLLTAFVHLYLTLMCGMILIGICLQDVLKRRTAKRSIVLIGIYILTAAAATALLGGFSSPLAAGRDGLGWFSFNLNGFTNPQGWSAILQTKPMYISGQYEGFAYLGAGCILLVFVSLILFFGSGRVKELWTRHWKTAAALLSIMIISVAFAASPIAAYGDRLLWSMNLPQWVWDMWSVFRVSGRFAWCAVYILMLCSCVMVCKLLSRRSVGVLLAAVLAVQVYDIYPALQKKHQDYGNEVVYETPLADTAFWDYAGDDPEIRHVVYYSFPGDAYMYALTDWAADHGKTVSNFYFARDIDPEILEKNQNAALSALPEDTLFIFPGEARDDQKYRDYNLFCYDVKGLTVGRSKPIGDFEMTQNESQ